MRFWQKKGIFAKITASIMTDFLHIDHANDFALSLGAEVWHPMVSAVHFDELGEIPYTLNKLGVYAIFVQDNFPMNSAYGMGGYDTTKGVLTAASPGQIIGKADDGHREVYYGWALLFDPEFMRGTVFEDRLADYHFFSYNVNEALHATEDEKELLWRLMERMREIMRQGEQTALTDRILQDYIVLLCDYCLLFYERQFKSENKGNSDLLTRFQRVLTTYYERKLQHQYGLPNVKYCATELYLSPNYFGDVVRSITGDSPTQVIQRFLIDRAKSLMVGGHTITQVAEELGFEYPQHFTRFFKKHAGMPPSKYIASLKTTG